MLKTDVVIVGAGAVGCAIARELSKYHVDVVVVDKRDDVGGDASKSNSGIICSGYDAYPDTLESKLIVAANPMFDKLAAELEFPFIRCGALLPAFTDEQYEKLPSIKETAFKNHVYDIRVSEPRADPGNRARAESRGKGRPAAPRHRRAALHPQHHPHPKQFLQMKN